MKEKYVEDLKDIREIMNRSSRFISLSGLSGISAGILALAGAYLAYNHVLSAQGYQVYNQVSMPEPHLVHLLLIAMTTIILALASTIYFTTRESKKRQQKIWDRQTKKLLFSLIIPAITGGVVCIILMLNGYVGLVIPLTLVFYGLSLFTASYHTLNEVRILGLVEICLGLLALILIGYSLLIWSLGFGIVHIAYGAIIQRKYQS